MVLVSHRSDYDDPRQHRPPREPAGQVDPARLEASELAWRDEISDRLRSLSTGLALVGVLTVVGIGLAVWALVTAESKNVPRVGGSAARVAALERRVDDELASLRGREQALEARTATLADATRRNEQATATLATKVAAVDQLRRDVDQLQQRVDALERNSTAPSPTPTP